jgi:hypothetical protein
LLPKSAIRALRLLEALVSAVVGRYAASSRLDVPSFVASYRLRRFKNVLWWTGRREGGSCVVIEDIL